MSTTITCSYCQHTMPTPDETEPTRKVQWLYFFLCCGLSCITCVPTVYCFDSLTMKHTCPSCRKIFIINRPDDDRTTKSAKSK